MTVRQMLSLILPELYPELIAGGETSNPSIIDGFQIDERVTVYNNNLAYRVEGEHPLLPIG